MFEKEIRKFRELLRIGISAMKEASQVYVKAIDRDPAAKQAFSEQLPEIPKAAWSSFEKVGRGQMHEKLLLFGGRVHNLLRTLPLSEQTDALENGIELLLHDGGVMRVMPEALTHSQVSQVFGDGAIRGLEAQRAWMESRREYRPAYCRAPRDGYTVEGTVLVVSEPMSFRLDDLKDIISRMEAAR